MRFSAKAALRGALCLLAVTSCRGTSATTYHLWPEAGRDAGSEAGVSSTPLATDASVEVSSDSSQPTYEQPEAAVRPPELADAEAPPALDAGRSRRLRVGLQPTTANADAGTGELDLAVLESLALGSRALTLTTAHPQREVSFLRHLTETAEVDVILTLPVSDDLLVLDNESESETDLFRAIDDAMALFGQEAAFSYLILGERLDQLARTGDAGASWVTAVADALEYAQTHPLRPAELKIGVGLAANADVGRGLPEMWAQGIQAYALSFDGLDEQGRALSPDAAIAQWQQSVQTIGPLGKSVLFQEVSYPSADDKKAQREFFGQLRGVLAQPHESLTAVVISTLNDPPRAECESWAERWFPDAMLADLRCTIGLHDQSGIAKPAWSEVLEILARHTAP